MAATRGSSTPRPVGFSVMANIVIGQLGSAAGADAGNSERVQLRFLERCLPPLHGLGLLGSNPDRRPKRLGRRAQLRHPGPGPLFAPFEGPPPAVKPTLSQVLEAL